jgi:hypothetical protein
VVVLPTPPFRETTAMRRQPVTGEHTPAPAGLRQRPGDATKGDRLLTEPLRLINGVESLEGANGEPMLFDGASGRYTRVSRPVCASSGS